MKTAQAVALLLAGNAAASLIPNPGQQRVLKSTQGTVDEIDVEGLPWVNSDDLQKTMKLSNLMKRANHLYDIAGLSKEQYKRHTRVIGSQGHLGTIDYVFNTTSSLGGYYKVSKQDFYAVNGRVHDSRLIIGKYVIDSAVPMRLTPPTPNKEPLHARLALVLNGGCKPSDFPANVRGRIALVERGSCSFTDKSSNAFNAGAKAAIIYNNERGKFSGTLGDIGEHVPTIGISGRDARKWVEHLLRGDTAEASLYIDATLERIKTTNVIAETNHGDPDNIVMLGAHSDSVAAGPGINDDGSGTITLLELATQLTKFRVRNKVRFAWWAAEEEGLLGSFNYALTLPPDENRKIRLFMDYDMMASPNFAFQVYDGDNRQIRGNKELRDMYIDWYESKGLNWTLIPFDGRSDYAPFLLVGIPAGGVATGAEGVKTDEEVEMFGGKSGVWYDYCYHMHCDDLGNLNQYALHVNAELIAHSVALYADSLELFPPRRSLGDLSQLNVLNGASTKSPLEHLPAMKYRGSDLVY